MRTNSKILIALGIGAVAGALAMKGLHAQAKPVGYVISEIEISDREGFMKEFLPLMAKAAMDAGAKPLVRGGQTAPIYGEAPKGRIVIWQFETLEKAQAVYASPAVVEAKKVGDKYAKFRTFAVEGVPPQ